MSIEPGCRQVRARGVVRGTSNRSAVPDEARNGGRGIASRRARSSFQVDQLHVSFLPHNGTMLQRA